MNWYHDDNAAAGAPQLLSLSVAFWSTCISISIARHKAPQVVAVFAKCLMLAKSLPIQTFCASVRAQNANDDDETMTNCIQCHAVPVGSFMAKRTARRTTKLSSVPSPPALGLFNSEQTLHSSAKKCICDWPMRTMRNWNSWFYFSRSVCEASQRNLNIWYWNKEKENVFIKNIKRPDVQWHLLVYSQVLIAQNFLV